MTNNIFNYKLPSYYKLDKGDKNMLFNKNCCCNRQGGFGMPMTGCCQPQMEGPVMEPTITKCVEKEFYHEVPQEW